MCEIWKPLIYGKLNLVDRYEISNFGNLRNIKTKKILKTHINKQGYEVICISLGKRKTNKLIKIHRAVAFMFVNGYQEGFVVNHIDGNKLNNLCTNLEWVTQKDNVIHASENNLLKYSKSVICEQTQMIFPSIKAACRWCGLKSGNSLVEYLRSNTRKSAGKNPENGEPLTWHLI